jgi:hypothetical protein
METAKRVYDRLVKEFPGFGAKYPCIARTILV